jgi:hypothetical protein
VPKPTLSGIRYGEHERHVTDFWKAESSEPTPLVFVIHGGGMPSSKRWSCNSGLQVPVIGYFPEKWMVLAPKEYAPGAKSDRLVSFVDYAPTKLCIADIRPPEWMHGHAFAG